MTSPFLRLSPQELRLYRTLEARRGEVVTVDDLVRSLWPNPDREPATAEKHISVLIHRMRCKGLALGRVSGYRLPK